MLSETDADCKDISSAWSAEWIQIENGGRIVYNIRIVFTDPVYHVFIPMGARPWRPHSLAAEICDLRGEE